MMADPSADVTVLESPPNLAALYARATITARGRGGDLPGTHLARKGVGETLASLIDGAFKADFSGGFGATVTMSTIANPTGGKAIQFPEKLRSDIFLWDAFKKDDMYYTAGYDRDGYVLIVTGYGYTMPTAWENVMKKAEQIKFPYRQYRPDGDGVNYPSSPIRRYQALTAMGYI